MVSLAVRLIDLKRRAPFFIGGARKRIGSRRRWRRLEADERVRANVVDVVCELKGKAVARRQHAVKPKATVMRVVGDLADTIASFLDICGRAKVDPLFWLVAGNEAILKFSSGADAREEIVGRGQLKVRVCAEPGQRT